MKKTVPFLTLLALSLTATAAPPARAIDVRRAARQHELPLTIRNRLTETLSQAAAPYLDDEDMKRSRGETYVDFSPKFEYLPAYGAKGHVTVSAKMGGAEYKPGKSTDDKGMATGVLKYLIFTYKLDDGNWIEVGKPRWETQNLGPQAAHEMTESTRRAAKRRKEAIPKSAEH